jgi:hypothetical protein
MGLGRSPVVVSEPYALARVFELRIDWSPAMAAKSPRVIDVEEDSESDLEEEREREGEPTSIDKLEEGEIVDEDDEIVEVEQEEE